MVKRIDVMVDIETLGTDSSAPIFQIAAIAFDIETGEHYDKFNKIADIEKEEYMPIDGSTLKWWLNTNKELLTDLLNKGKGSLDDLLDDFQKWLEYLSDDAKNIYLWGNGILFDNKMLQYQLREYPIYYKNDRDVRTIVDLAGKKLGVTEQELKDSYNNDSLVAHDAFDDVKYQINLVVGCYKELIKNN
ncbi:3'-5' exoribonuclease [Cytobacillus kochii]|uniref:3'-5' exonuclease n=1 Tax=Cytobacillus kochii TaxID=859143 RepID=UPI001CD624EF|nr:3'-5' exonuclease [Cytobacillus kochii]MCA1027052.1 3'-5' exoribonuclease [Cytobacillus kochii]